MPSDTSWQAIATVLVLQGVQLAQEDNAKVREGSLEEIEAAQVLDTDPEYRKVIGGLRDRLLKPRIGSWGQLMEWPEDRDDIRDEHRHVSHLFALHPGPADFARGDSRACRCRQSLPHCARRPIHRMGHGLAH